MQPIFLGQQRHIRFYKCTIYSRSGNIREVLIFANFAWKTNSRIQESRENYYYNSGTKEK